MTPDAICAPDVRSPAIVLALAEPNAPRRAHQPVALTVDWSKAALGLVPPFILTISSGTSRDSFRRQVYREQLPTRIVFFPVEGGPHVVRVAEVYHQQYVGTLRVDVEGERLELGTL